MALEIIQHNPNDLVVDLDTDGKGMILAITELYDPTKMYTLITPPKELEARFMCLYNADGEQHNPPLVYWKPLFKFRKFTK